MATFLPAPTERELRAALRRMRGKSARTALVLFSADAAAYAAATVLACAIEGPLRWAFSAAAGVSIAMLFVLGHDACHGSLTASPRLNRWLGTLAFLPSLTPFTAWELGHNQTHHVYTNLKPRDYVWMPFTKREFDALPRWRQWLERLYRTVPGLGLYYGIEIWAKRLFFARDPDTQRRRPQDLAGSLLCTAYALALSAAAFLQSGTAFLAGVLCPFLLWNALMGWAIFEHHTHPGIPWFHDESAWRAAQAQLRCTVHIVLPEPFDAILHRIMHHTAHHLDVTIPLYHLKAAQSALESEAAPAVIVYRWTPRTFLRHLRQCKLYDFERARWVGFDGEPG